MSDFKEKYIGEAKIKDEPKKKLGFKIADGAVTTDKIQNGAVTKDKIAEKSVGLPELASDVHQALASVHEGGIAVTNNFGDSEYIGISQKTITEMKDVLENDIADINAVIGEDETEGTLKGRIDALEQSDNTINQRITEEATRAQQAETALSNGIAGLTQSTVVVGTLPQSGAANTIYRVPGENSYKDYAWNGSSFTELAEYDNAIDDTPIRNSNNLVKSNGVWQITNSLSDRVNKIEGGVVVLEAVQKITGKHVYNGNMSGTAIGYFDDIASGYGCYIFDVSHFKGDKVTVYGTSHATGYRYIFCKDYTTLPQSQTEYNNAPTLWSNNMVSCLSGKAWTSDLDYNDILTIPEDANYLILEKSSTKTPTAQLVYIGVENTLLPLINSKADASDVSLDNYNSITAVGRESGYINGSGNIASGNYFYVDYYPVTAGKTVKITQKLHTGTARAFAFYNSTSMSSSTLVQLGGKMTSVEDITTIAVPNGATYLGITEFKSSQHGLEENNPRALKNVVVEMEDEIEDISASIAGNDAKTVMAWEIDANNLYVAYNDGNGIEYTYWFKKCMANELYTFYKVGYRSVSRTLPSTTEISAGTDITYINETSSDNIGPMQLSSNYWIGGNHHYPDESSSPLYKTAHTDAVNIYIDNVVQVQGSGYAKDIIVKVENTLFDPAYPPQEGDTSLSTPMATENVIYRIIKNTIEVGVSHKFVSSTTQNIYKYMGMQSMFSSETSYMTPLGAYKDWRDNTNNPTGSFSKGDYPNFNRYIEKKSGAYQASYLLPQGLGTHSKIDSSTNIFSRSNNKCYHYVVSSGKVTPLANAFIQWRGNYTFFHTAIADNEDILVYRGVIGGKDAVFASTKKSYSGIIPIPSELALKEMQIIEAVGVTDENGGTDFVNNNGVYIQGDGSIIVSFK